MSAWRAAAFGAIAATCIAVAPRPALAQTRVETTVSGRRVELGERFFLQASAMGGSGGATPSAPRLVVPPGISASGPSVSTQQQVTIAGGQIQQRQGVTATWTLSASQTGTFRIGPPSFTVGGGRAEGQSVTVEVVPVGRGGTPPQRQPRFDPFDIFRGGRLPNFPGLGDADPGQPDPDLLPPFPDELKIDRARDPVAFLHARTAPTRAVLGEQLTLSIIAYGGRGPFREVNPTEPSRQDFLSHTLIENSYGEEQHRVPIGDTVFFATTVRKYALFPIRVGRLVVGPMKMGFEGRNYPASGTRQGLLRQSEPLEIEVVEPPVAGRPPGYRLGDAGRYTLGASVEPREISASDAISVVVKLEGTGNLPHRLNTPQHHGVEWLEPAVIDDIEAQGGIVRGWRKFTYVVRLAEAGTIELGAISLPFWDPQRQAYDVARAELGKVVVKPTGRKADARSEERPDALQGVLTPRKALGAPAASHAFLADRRAFWWLIFLAPLGVVVVTSSVRLGRRLREYWQNRREAHATRIKQILEEARMALGRDDRGAAAGAVERAIVVGIEAATGIKARGLLRDELRTKLSEAGLDELAGELVELLDACDGLRFRSDQNGSADELVTRTEALALKLTQKPPKRSDSRVGA